jgi:hypothetical protein
MQSKYKTLNSKLHRLTQEQTNTPREHHPFYPRVINNTDISFSKEEMTLLERAPNTTYTPDRNTGSQISHSKPRLPLPLCLRPTATTTENRYLTTFNN